MRYSAQYWIGRLHLTRHIEGGYFSEVYRSSLRIDPQQISSLKGSRNISTSIYFLLEQGQFSAFHRIQSDELWHFYDGDGLEIFELEPDGRLTIHQLGSDPEKEQQFQCVVKAGNWFASAPAPGSEYSLCGCTVSPGFDYEDFELANSTTLIRQFPQHTALITSLTR